MPDNKKFDHLIGMLYETALDPDLWKEAMGLCGHYVGGIETVLYTRYKKDNALRSFQIAETAFFPEQASNYASYYVNLDPAMDYLSQGDIGEVRFNHKINDQAFVNCNEFYQDFFIPIGARYSMVCKIDGNNDYFTYLCALRGIGQQPFGFVEQQAAQSIVGHFQRALRLQKHTEYLQAKVELGARAIDTLALAMLIIDCKRVILHLNASAEHLLNHQHSGLASKDGCLLATHSDSNSRLKALVAKATDFPATGGAMFLNNESNGQMFVTPLPASSPFAKDWQTPLALVVVIEADKNPSALQLLGTLYDLSPAELRVAVALLKGDSLENYAAEVGVQLSTVRSQLKNLFAKTQTHRQAELVSLLSKLPPIK